MQEKMFNRTEKIKSKALPHANVSHEEFVWVSNKAEKV